MFCVRVHALIMLLPGGQLLCGQDDALGGDAGYTVTTLLSAIEYVKTKGVALASS